MKPQGNQSSFSVLSVVKFSAMREKNILKGLFTNALSCCLFFCLMLIIAISENSSASGDIKSIEDGLQSRDWQTRLAAVEKIGANKDDYSIGMLMKVAAERGEYWRVKIKAILLLGESGDPKVTGLLLSIFNDTFNNWECPSIKSYAAIALGNLRDDKRVVEALINGIGDRELLTREASIRSLGRIGSATAVPHLIDVLGDKSPAVRLSAIKALREIGDQQAIPYLRNVAENDGDYVVQREAVKSLEALLRIEGKD